MSKVERRVLPLTELRADVAAEGEAPKIRGYAAVFNSLSEDLGGFREKIDPGAFARSINNEDVRATFNHDPRLVLGRRSSGTLALREDERGLYVEITPPDTQYARDLLVSIARGDVSGMSFTFRTLGDKWHRENGERIRTLTEVQVFELGPVTFPAYGGTSAAVRSTDPEMFTPELPADEAEPEAPHSTESRRRRLALAELN